MSDGEWIAAETDIVPFRQVGRGKLTLANVWQGLVLAWRLLTRVGLRADYRTHFWQAGLYALKRGQIDAAMGIGFVGHHLIQFTREALRGEQNASFYSPVERAKTVQTAERAA